MNPIKILKKEHEDIERELLELEEITQSETINYPNLIHVFRKLHEIWNLHEQKEEKIFNALEKEKIKIPVEKMLFEHKELSKHKKEMLNAINSGSEFKIKQALYSNGKFIIKKLREHIKDEEDILFSLTLSEFKPEQLKAIYLSIK